MKLPDLRFSEHFLDTNHVHNIYEADVIDALFERTIVVTKPYKRNGKIRRRIFAKTDSSYITVICEVADDFWWVMSAFPSSDADERRAREHGIGAENYD